MLAPDCGAHPQAHLSFPQRPGRALQHALAVQPASNMHRPCENFPFQWSQPKINLAVDSLLQSILVSESILVSDGPTPERNRTSDRDTVPGPSSTLHHIWLPLALIIIPLADHPDDGHSYHVLSGIL